MEVQKQKQKRKNSNKLVRYLIEKFFIMKIVTSLGKKMDVSPKKARIVAEIIKGMKVSEALSILDYIPKKAAGIIKKVLKSATANAVHNYSLSMKDLVVKNVYVDKSIVLKRVEYAAKGRIKMFNRTFSNIKVEIQPKNDVDV